MILDTVGFESGPSKLNFGSARVPIRPHSWYHACYGVDALRGSFRVVMNGITLYDEFVEPLQKSLIPKSLAGKINMLMTGRSSSFYYQTRGSLTNMNVFGSMLNIEDMIEMTNTTNCVKKGDYLAWSYMNLNFTGKIDRKSVNIEEELCNVKTSNIVLFTSLFLEWEECM